MQGPDFLYFLCDKDGRSYNVQDGLIVTNSVPRPLEFTPDGWQEISITNERNKTYFGIDRSFTIPLNFVEDGAKIIKDFFYRRKGTEGQLYLVILQQQVYVDETTYYYYYDRFYRGAIDFSQFNHDGPVASVNIMEDGFPKMLKDNDGTTYEIPLTEQNPAKVKMDGILLFGKQTYTIIPEVPLECNHTQNHFWQTVLNANTSEGVAPGISFVNQSYREQPSFNDLNDKTNFFLINTLGESSSNDSNVKFLTLNFKGHLDIRCETNNPAQIRARFLKVGKAKSNDSTDWVSSGNSYHTYYYVIENFLTIPAGVNNVVRDFDININVAPGEYLNFEFTMFSPGAGVTGNYQFNKNSTFTVSFKNTFAATYAPNILLPDLFKKLINLMTRGQFEGVFNLPTQPFCAITCGDWLRNLDKAVMKVTWKKLWSFIDLNFDAALYVVDKKVYLSQKKDLLDFSDSIDYGIVSGPKIKPNLDFLFNYLKIGYPNQDYSQQYGDTVNGREEFNTTHEYKVPISSTDNPLEKTSEIRADGYGMEFTRQNLDGKETTASNADNDLFASHVGQAIHTDSDGVQYRNLDRQLNASATGLLTPETVFNLSLSPKQCLYRKKEFLKSCLYWHDADKLVFQTTDKNAEVAVGDYYSGINVVEKSDVLIGDMGERYFIPLLIEGNAPTPENTLQLLEQNPKKTARLTINGTEFKGIPMKTGVQPETNAAQAIQIMCAATIDITKLIDYYG